MEYCISSALPAFKAQSSAKRKSLSLSTWTFVLASSLLKLTSLPISSVSDVHAWVGFSKGICKHSWEHHGNQCWGKKTQPCFTPFVTGKGGEGSLSSRTCASIPPWSCRTTWINLSGQPNLLMIFQRPSPLTVSNVLVRSTNVVYMSTFCSWYFSCSWRAANIISVVPRSFLNPHWLSGSRPCSRWSMSRLRRILARMSDLANGPKNLDTKFEQNLK